MFDHPAVVLDVETYSEQKLDGTKSVGAVRYARDESTDCLMLSYTTNRGKTIKRWRAGDPPPVDLTDAHSRGLLYYADNAPFDRAIWKYVLSEKYGWPYPGDEAFMDIAVLKCYVGLPRSVDVAAKALRLEIEKDRKGYELMRRMCKPAAPIKASKDPKRLHTPEALLRLEEYCDRDVAVEQLIVNSVPMLPKYTRRAWRASERMNARGVKIDRTFVRNAIHILEVHRQKLRGELSELTGGVIPSESMHKRFGKFLIERGIETYPTDKGGVKLDKEFLPIYLDEARKKGDGILARVLEIRQELNKSSVAKYQAMERCAVPGDDRLYGMLVFYGAHTGRWTGSLVQLQNLPKGDQFTAEWIDYARNLVREADYESLIGFFGDQFMTLMGALVRAALIPGEGKIFHVSDYSAIEGRGLAWLAGETHIIDAYIKGLDLYRMNAAITYRIPYEEVDGGAKKGPMRKEGKVGELAGGYGGGAGAFKKMAKDAVGITLTDSRAKELRDLWRSNRPKTVALWKNMEKAAKYAIANPGLVVPVTGIGGKIKFKMEGGHLKMRLPSGRVLYYRNAYVEMARAKWDPEQEIPTIFYWGVHPETKNWTLLDTYGGKLTENAVQALCADLLYEALPRLEREGFSPVLTVHDEIISEDPVEMNNIGKFNEVMSAAPEWAEGFPIAAEGFVTHYYRKD